MIASVSASHERVCSIWDSRARIGGARHDAATVPLAAVDGSAIEHSQEEPMSERNGDRARFQKNRKRRLRLRQRIQELVKSLRVQPAPTGDARKPA